jgi:hypothetical protein
MKMREAKPSCSQAVNDGCAHLAAETADVRIAQVVGENENDVWSPAIFRLFLGKGSRRTGKSDLSKKG